ncbi:MAG TPA: hypothetical protein VGB67_07990 [Fibrella sp.]|jgi:hypothetical protein
MIVKLLTALAYGDKDVPAGSKVDLPEDEALSFIEKGIAEADGGEVQSLNNAPAAGAVESVTTPPAAPEAPATEAPLPADTPAPLTLTPEQVAQDFEQAGVGSQPPQLS